MPPANSGFYAEWDDDGGALFLPGRLTMAEDEPRAARGRASLSPPYPLNQIDGLSVWYEARLLEASLAPVWNWQRRGVRSCQRPARDLPSVPRQRQE